MSSYSDLQLNLNIKPQPFSLEYLAFAFALFFSLFILMLIRKPYWLPIYCAYLYYVYRCYVLFALLRHAKSVVAIACQHGNWQVDFHSGYVKKDLYLKHYYLSAHYIVLDFFDKQAERVNPYLAFLTSRLKPKQSVLIIPSQVGEAEFRYLHRLLKFQHKDLFLEHSAAALK